MHKASRTPSCLGLGLLLALAPGPTRAATEAIPTRFLQRLESIGLDTGFLRRMITGRKRPVEVFYMEPDEDREAQYGYILNNLYIPFTHKEETTRRIRFDLEPHHIDTMMHELNHAAYDVAADEDADRGTPEREHWEAVNAIWADLYLQKTLARYPRMKADEISSYFVGSCYNRLFSMVGDLEFVNIRLPKMTMQAPEDAERLGERFVLPWNRDHGYYRRMAGKRFDDGPAGNDEAYFEGKPIPWTERGWVKKKLYRYCLGTNPPMTTEDLLARLNDPELDNPWIRNRRKALREARAALAEKLREEARQAPVEPSGPQGLLGQEDRKP